MNASLIRAKYAHPRDRFLALFFFQSVYEHNAMKEGKEEVLERIT